MRNSFRPNPAERAGAWLGRSWRALARQERRAGDGLIRAGMPVGAVSVLVWGVRLSVLAVALCFFLIALTVCVIVFVVAHVQSTSERANPLEEYERRNGPEGFGVYNREGIRIDPYDPDRAFDPDGGII